MPDEQQRPVPDLRRLTPRAVLGGVGAVLCVVAAAVAWVAGLGWFSVVLVVIAIFALVDLASVLRRKRGEPR